MISIREFGYSTEGLIAMSYQTRLLNWPVVYIIHNDKEAYIGETLDAYYRTKQHLMEPEHRMLEKICFITDSTYNKSVILDLESFLIKYMSADGKYVLQNSNAGIQDHNYYSKETYEQNFQYIWEELCRKGLAQKSLFDIQNSDLYKYSPYKSLSYDQRQVLFEILRTLYRNPNPGIHSVIKVNGGAGTGKTILAVYLIKLLSGISDNSIDWAAQEETDYTKELWELSRSLGGRKLKIGLVVPMQSLRETLKKVFNSVYGLSSDMIVSPLEVPKQKYDVLVVDESHRLQQRRALAQYPAFDTNNKKFGLGNEGTELDWILKSSEHQILFYDALQSIRPSDIDREKFEKIVQEHLSGQFNLKSQLRCLGGNDYIQYISDILNVKNPVKRSDFKGYELRIYDNAEKMAEDIKKKNKQYTLCRMVSGYGFEWISKKHKDEYDIRIGDYRARWNKVFTDWIGSPNSVNEVGCIHTVQGYDLNYCGVIFGPEIGFDKEKNEIIIYKNNYYDWRGKSAIKSEYELKEYIINIYLTLMTRGIHGTYIYVCDCDLREYLHQYIVDAER